MNTAGLKMTKFGKIYAKDKKEKKPVGGNGNADSLIATLNDQVFQE